MKYKNNFQDRFFRSQIIIKAGQKFNPGSTIQVTNIFIHESCFESLKQNKVQFTGDVFFYKESETPFIKSSKKEKYIRCLNTIEKRTVKCNNSTLDQYESISDFIGKGKAQHKQEYRL